MNKHHIHSFIRYIKYTYINYIHIFFCIRWITKTHTSHSLFTERVERRNRKLLLLYNMLPRLLLLLLLLFLLLFLFKLLYACLLFSMKKIQSCLILGLDTMFHICRFLTTLILPRQKKVYKKIDVTHNIVYSA